MRWLYPVVGVLAFLATLAATAPAAYWLAWSGVTERPGVGAAGVHGSAWAGGAERVSANTLALTDLRWHLQPAGLVQGRLRFAVAADTAGGHVEGTVAVAPGGGTHVPALRLIAPLSDLARAAGLAILPLSGQVSARLDDVVLEDGWPVAADGRVALGEVRWRLAEPNVTLGAFEARLQTLPEGGVSAALGDLGGPVTLRGSAQLTADGQWTLDLRLRPAADAGEDVRDLLALMGTPDPQGWYRIRQRGQVQ